jgi:hypothetical protein
MRSKARCHPNEGRDDLLVSGVRMRGDAAEGRALRLSAALVRRLAIVSGVVLVTLGPGCGRAKMVPEDGARLVRDAPGYAVAERAGVRMAASGDVWKGRPADLPERLTPVKVRLVNRSGRDLQILYGRFVLVGARGRKYRPLPPVPPAQDASRAGMGTVRPYFAPSNFFVRPADHDVYPSLPPWPTRLRSDDVFYARQYDRWGDEPPSRELQRLALPEGVLASGGEIAGFLYFENATGRESKLALRADLRDEEGRETVASISIPFRVE